MAATAANVIRLNREEGLGGTDARRIVAGDWLPLYEEKLGLRQPENLDHVFKVQLGVHTEDFHLDWLARWEGWNIKRIHDRLYHPIHRFMYAHVDGWIVTLGVPIECKHCAGNATVRDRAQFYMAQLQHYLAVTEADHIVFSMIAGNDEPEHVRIDRDEAYIAKLIDLEASFWWHVEERVPPMTDICGQAQLAEMAAVIPIDGLRDYDMQGHNEWAANVAGYIQHESAAQAFERHKKALKELVPADAASCRGYGLVIKRARNGSLRFA